MYDYEIILVAETETVDKYGDTVLERKERSVFAELASIGMSEFYQAQAMGFKPEVKFILPDYLDYEFEKTILFKDYGKAEYEEYSVLRTYRNGNTLEITCKRGID